MATQHASPLIIETSKFFVAFSRAFWLEKPFITRLKITVTSLACQEPIFSFARVSLFETDEDYYQNLLNTIKEAT